MLKSTNLQVEYKVDPIGMDEEVPRFSYIPEGTSKKQTARQICVTCECGKVVWDSGKVASSSTFQIEYAGERLKPFTRYFWKVRLWDENGKAGSWSNGKAFFETGFLETAWTAQWITCRLRAENMQAADRIRRQFDTGKKKVVKARLYVTALGLYSAYLNGKPVSGDCFTPGWTVYTKRVQYQAYDVLPLLEKGENTLAFELAEGWYCGRIARIWTLSDEEIFAKCPELLTELHLTYADGKKEIIASGDTFKHAVCANADLDRIRMSDIYMGEKFWAMKNGNAWRYNDFKSDECWKVTLTNRKDTPAVVWQSGAPVRHIMNVKPVKITRRKCGNWIVDFGQNLTGRERIRLKNVQAGTTIVIRHGEMLTEYGSLYTDNLRTADATTTYIAHADRAEEVYEPSFTFYGFRYLEITGWPNDKKLTADDIEARVIHSDLPMTGDFKCSEPLLNQLYSNVVWGQRSNFLDVPTDCPQRDERLGWTGDTQVFANTATYNMYAPEFYTKWLADLNVQRSPKGAYAYFMPMPFQKVVSDDHACTGWGDAGVICPWVMFRKYGDKRLIRKYFDNMCRWLDYQVERANGSLIVKNAIFGDWLNIDAPTREEVLSTAYLAGMNRLVAQMAEIIGLEDDRAYRMQLHHKISEAFIKEFYTGKYELKEKTQTAALLALEFVSLPEAAVKKTLAFLEKDIRVTKDLHLSTGFLGTPLLLKVLTDHGKTDLAYDLLLQTTYPSWLYPVKQGATTMWERWNSWTKEKGFGDVNMNSYNHYAYGAVAEWFFETICGIRDCADSVKTTGYQRFRLAPQPGKRLKWAEASYKSMSGLIKSSWKRTGKKWIWKFTVPVNTEAEIVIPFGSIPAGSGLEERDGKWIATSGDYSLTLTE